MKTKLILTLLSCGCLASCGLPLKASFIGEYGVYSYSSKSGLEIQLHLEK